MVKARKGVVLTCGGFENNQEMIRNYLTGLPYCYTSGSPHNEGDGVTMALAVGADLAHEQFRRPSMALKVRISTTFSMQALHYSKEIPGGVIVVGPDGKRFTDEKFKTCHGKVAAGTWKALTTPCPMYMIFDQKHMSAGPIYDAHPSHGWTQIVVQYEWSEDNTKELEGGWIVGAETIPELAAKIGLDLDVLADRWTDGTAWSPRVQIQILAGRSCLKRLERGHISRSNCHPRCSIRKVGHAAAKKHRSCVPTVHPSPAFTAPESSVQYTATLYQGTGNIGECLAFGRIAARQAVAQTAWS